MFHPLVEPRVRSVVAKVVRAPEPELIRGRFTKPLCNMPSEQVERLQVHRLISLQIFSDREIQLRPNNLPAVGEEQTITVELGADESLLGFRWHERPDTATGGSIYYNPWVVTKNGEAGSLQALFGTLAMPTAQWPGELHWMPTEASKSQYKSAMQSLRVLRGQTQDYIVGITFMPDSDEGRIKRTTGGSLMYWVELFFFDMFLYYLDVVTDINQLFLVFLQKKLLVYFCIYSLGILISMLVTITSFFEWLDTNSPETDWLRARLPHHVSPVLLKIIATFLVLTQTHIVALVAFSTIYKYKHPLMTGAKMAETLEAALAATITVSSLVDTLGEDGIAAHKDELQSVPFILKFLSLGSSLCTLALGFTSRDKEKSGKVLELRGRLDGWGPQVLMLWAIRTFEVTSRVFAFNIIHEGVNGLEHDMHYAVVMATISLSMMLLVGLAFHPYAGMMEAIAGIFAHPGQVREGASVLPIARSIALHLLVSFLAASAQFLAWMRPTFYTQIFPDGRLAEGWILWVWGTSTCIAIGGLLYYRQFPLPIDEHPLLKIAAGDGDTLHVARLVKAQGSRSTPALSALLAQCGKRIILDLETFRVVKGVLDKALQEATTAEKRRPHYLHEAMIALPPMQLGEAEWGPIAEFVRSAKFVVEVDLTKCFESDGAGAAPLLAALSTSRRLRKLILFECKAIPDDAWASLSEAQWPALEEVDLTECFAERGGGASSALRALSTSQRLRKLNLHFCEEIPDEAWHAFQDVAWPDLVEDAWQQLAQGATWPELQSVDVSYTKSPGPVWPQLLQALSGCLHLQELDVSQCDIPNEAWEQVPGGSWPELHTSNGVPDDQRTRICYGQPVQSSARRLVEETEEHVEVGVQDWDIAAIQPSSTVQELYAIPGCENDSLLLPTFRAVGQGLTALNLSRCSALPQTAWAALAEGLQHAPIRKVDLSACFVRNGDGAREILEVLATCSQLEELQIRNCNEIGAAWSAVSAARWPELLKADVSGCFSESGDGAEAALGALGRCQNLQKLDLCQCSEIGAAWSAVSAAHWPELRKADLTSCFNESGDGAEAALGALGRCQNLQELDFGLNGRAPASAWEAVPEGAWAASCNIYTYGGSPPAPERVQRPHEP